MSQNGPEQDPWGKPGQSSGPKQSDNSSDKQNENGWGSRDNKNQEQSPPDIEEVFNNLLNYLTVLDRYSVPVYPKDLDLDRFATLHSPFV